MKLTGGFIISNLVRIVYYQHMLHYRWLLDHFIALTDSRLVYAKLLLFLFPFTLGAFSFYISKGIFSYTLSLEWVPARSTLEALFMIVFFLLFWVLLFRDYKHNYARAFYSHDSTLYLAQGIHFILILTAKLIDVFFLSVWLFIYPILIGISLAWNSVYSIKIPLQWFTIDFGLLLVLILLLRNLSMIIMFLVKSTKKQRGQTYWFQHLHVLALGKYIFIGIGSYIVTILFIQTHTPAWSWQSLQSEHLNLFHKLSFPTQWLITGKEFYFLLLLFSLLITFVTLVIGFNRILYVKSQLTTRYVNRDYSSGLRLLETPNMPNWLLLIMKDLIIVWRDKRTLMTPVGQFLSMFMAFLGTLGALRNSELFHSQTVSLSAIIAMEFIFSTFAGNMISRITSIDAEGRMISTLLLYLRSPAVFMKSKLILHSLFVGGVITSVTILLSLMFRIEVTLFLYSLCSSLLITMTHSLSFIVSSAIFPKFNWDHETRIGTSSKAVLLESLFLRVYEFGCMISIAVAAVYLYTNALSPNQYYICILCIIILFSSVWISILLLLYRIPWWKGWKF
ncbi:hypothetical protein ABNF72_15865 [Paenibacillus larvae]|uniref:Uncharacterized protein n=2 Tax=Paenibacillus larvae TaxID=1464 RepID=A0A6C0QTS3_9BACL|nr:hypothetical protein [Paenibacillus larvae]QHZ52072.1 hypothetical protein ERICV_02953 [Paenibacillus larvae subsp. larvae]